VKVLDEQNFDGVFESTYQLEREAEQEKGMGTDSKQAFLLDSSLPENSKRAFKVGIDVLKWA